MKFGEQLGGGFNAEWILDIEGENALQQPMDFRREFAVFGIMFALLDAELPQHFHFLQVLVDFPRYKVHFFQQLPLMMLQFAHDLCFLVLTPGIVSKQNVVTIGNLTKRASDKRKRA